MTKHLSVSWVVVCLLSGCELIPTDPAGSATGDTGVEAGKPGGPAGDDDDDVEKGGWAFSTHPCVGYRTDTLWVDDADTFWVGCGTTANGYGLYLSTDGGRTWDTPNTDVPGFFQSMRVNSISRSADGLLYVGGIHGAEQVLALDTTTDPMVVSEVFTSTSQVWNTFQVGAFRRNSAGLAVAESLNGTGLAFRSSDDAPFEDGEDWSGGGSYQILDLALHDDAFYGVGSTISQPPYVYLPPPGGQVPGEPFRMSAIQMVAGLGEFAGELWGLDVDDHGVVAAGVNQDRDVGYLFVSDADPWDIDAWRSLDVSTVVGDDPTWMRGVCRSGATIIALGEWSRDSTGLVLRSDDDGATFVDVTPSDLTFVPAVHRCEILADGTVIIVGGEGFVGISRP